MKYHCTFLITIKHYKNFPLKAKMYQPYLALGGTFLSIGRHLRPSLRIITSNSQIAGVQKYLLNLVFERFSHRNQLICKKSSANCVCVHRSTREGKWTGQIGLRQHIWSKMFDTHFFPRVATATIFTHAVNQPMFYVFVITWRKSN